jgi:3'(2'), 5'-bisphosphate nucleotidase
MTAHEQSDDEIAREIAASAGQLLVELRASAGSDPALGTLGDRASHDLIVAALAKSRPGDAVLSEEGAQDDSRLSAQRIWIVDPLDGTREYGESGRIDWAVHVALVDGDGVPRAGAVALPAEELTFSTVPAPELPPLPARPPRIVVSRSRPPARLAEVREALEGEIVYLGSAGAKAMAVVRGDADVYLHSGGQHEWDSCAPVAVALAAGLHASRADGSPLVYNRPDPWMPDLLICRPELAAPTLAAVAAGG